ncbi:MAG: sigma-70 family RNA polymerase sigma factor [Candidatus Aminicenantes bacterium]|nr:sigma-70 family RNA polymerase sigma factor [Candidatus Aminicenantes bacterium]
MMRTTETNYEFENNGQDNAEVLYKSPVPEEQDQFEPGGTGRDEKPVFSDIEYYFGQLKNIPKDYLSPEKIKETYEAVKPYERAILSVFYFMDSFLEGLCEIRNRFEIKEKCGKKSTNGSVYTKEQLNFIAKISRKPLYKTDDKEADIIRVKAILDKICIPPGRNKKLVNFQALFDRLLFRNDSYVKFIRYLGNMVNRIEANEWGKKTGKMAEALHRYTGVNYKHIRETFEFLQRVTDLHFENEYYYQKPQAALRKILKSADRQMTDDPQAAEEMSPYEIRKSLNRIEGYEREIKKILNKFSEKYFRYVVFIAKQFINGKFAFSDIIQEGNIGLLKAVKKYNYELGHKFITYAFWWIRQGITKAIADQSRTIRIPFHVHQEYHNIKKVIQRLKKDLWEEPDVKFIANVTGKSEEQVQNLLETFEYPLSLSQEIKKGAGKPLFTFKPDIKAVDPSMQLEKTALKEEIYYYLNSLDEREAELIKMRYGLKDGNVYTLEEVARRFQLTRERVRQIEVKVLSRLKKTGADRLKPYLSHNYEDADYCIA